MPRPVTSFGNLAPAQSSMTARPPSDTASSPLALPTESSMFSASPTEKSSTSTASVDYSSAPPSFITIKSTPQLFQDSSPLSTLNHSSSSQKQTSPSTQIAPSEGLHTNKFLTQRDSCQKGELLFTPQLFDPENQKLQKVKWQFGQKLSLSPMQRA